MIESALYFGDLPGTNPLEVRLGPLPKKGRRVDVSLEIRIPMDEITMLPYKGRYVAELELRIGERERIGSDHIRARIDQRGRDDEHRRTGLGAVSGGIH